MHYLLPCPASMTYRVNTFTNVKKKVTTEYTKKEAQRKARVKSLFPL